MKVREFIRDHVEAAGGVLERKDSDHHYYRLPNGRVLLVPVGGKHTDIKPYLVSKLKRLLRATTVVIAAMLLVDCTSILGDFSIADTGATEDGGSPGVDSAPLGSGDAGAEAAVNPQPEASAQDAGSSSSSSGSSGGSSGSSSSSGGSSSSSSSSGGSGSSSGSGGDGGVQVPSGWTLVEASFSTSTPPSCGAWTGTSWLSYDTLDAPAATCGCTCGAPTGISCSYADVGKETSCGVSGGSCVSALAGNQCVAWGAAYASTSMYCSTAAAIQSAGGSCAAAPSTTRPATSWGGQARACAPPAGSCTGGQCAPPSLDPTFNLCIEQSGEQTCPSGWANPHVEYASVTDARGCSACTCGVPSGVSCGGSLHYYADSQCTTATSACPMPYIRYEPAPTGSCTPSTVTPTGNATPAGATTFCCR